MHRARADRMGLIAFAGDAFLTCPLTLDDAAFGQSVDSLPPRIAWRKAERLAAGASAKGGTSRSQHPSSNSTQ